MSDRRAQRERLNNLRYIECAGVRVPADWNIAQLTEALAKRKIRFSNEAEITAVFGEAIRLKQKLEENIARLRAEGARLETYYNTFKDKLTCPSCMMLIIPAKQ